MPNELPKIIIVDASVMFSFFKKSSNRRMVAEELSAHGSELVSPNFAFGELYSKK